MKANDLTELELVRAEQLCRLNHQLLYLMAVYAKDARDIDHVVGRLHIGHEQITHITLSRQVDRNTAKADHFSLRTIVHHPSAPHHQPIALRPAPPHPRRRRPHAPPNRAHPRPTARTPALTEFCVKALQANRPARQDVGRPALRYSVKALRACSRRVCSCRFGPGHQPSACWPSGLGVTGLFVALRASA